jgi:transposase-like protein
MIDLTNKIFHDEDAAREHLEAQRWPDGPVCPHCGARDVTKLEGKAHRPGVYQCKVKPCREQFTVTVGSVMERSHIPLTKWVLAIQLMAASKKGVSAKQIERMLGVSYRTAWFLMHRIREAMNGVPSTGPLGGQNKVVESDETYIGGKAKNVHKLKPIPKKRPVVTLVEREGEVRARHVPDVTAKNVREHLVTQASRKSFLMTDDAPVSHSVGKEFAGHGAVNHSADEYVRLGGFIHVNTAESYHALVKRSIFGAWHAVSEQHLQRYIDEISFRWNTRIALGYDDTRRAAAIIKATEGKRLTYRRSHEA